MPSRHTHGFPFHLLLALAFTAGCTLEAGESDIGDQDVSEIAEDVQGDTISEGLGPGIGVMDGTWLSIHENSACVSVAGLVEEQLSVVAYLVDIETEGPLTRETRRMCYLDLAPILGLKPIVPDAAARVVEFHPIDYGYASNVGLGGSYVSSTEVHTWGIRMDDPVNEPWPSATDDPRIFDADETGRPGVTFRVSGGVCDRYNIQRSISRYFGTFTTPNQIDGRSTTRTETFVIGASSPVCNINVRLLPNDPFSRFRMVRVDGQGGSIDLDFDGDGEVTCDEVAQAFDQIWEPRAKNDENCRGSRR